MAKIQERLSGKIANVSSTVEGMQITIQLPVLEPKEISEEEIRRRELNMKLKAYHKLLGVNYQLKSAVKKRMERCTTNLAKHLDSITFSDANVVVYEGGHFSYPAYAAMQELLQDLDIEVANGVADRYDKVFSTPMKRLQLLKAAQMFNFTLLDEDELEWLFGYLTEQATRIEH
jgi:hypothetical protein